MKELEKSKSILSDISKYDQLNYQYETALNDRESIAVMKEELQRAKKLAGLVPLEDRGIVLRIEDNDSAPTPVEYPTERGNLPPSGESSGVVLDDDLRWLVNEMLANGAKAISINGNRLISTSSIRNVGDEIQVDTKTIQPPYEIKALGEPETLISGLKLEGVENFFLQSVNKQIVMEEREHLVIPAFTGEKTIRFMTPVKAKGDS
ncbi:DUF881 domain-containing protein [Brevibacillus dissolubilis]|uniref:DUF881 domain-containing protein n=1 Tax=Brevibacillus dissolubilis TaxID=1844116 RepID=UPI002100209A|nr:DUF881 domain-containing protein [Brevibacillus dissolubilis]